MSLTIDPLALHAPTRHEERRPLGRRTRRVGVVIFFASVIVNAALGMYAVVAPGFGETQGKILGTSLCVTGAVLVALACEPAWERKLLGPVPVIAAALGAAGFALAIIGIWTQPENEIWAKVMTTIFTASVAGIAASLLRLAQVAPRHAWLFRVTFVLLAVGAAMFSLVPWFNEPGEWFVRSLGVVMIALAAFVVTIPVVHWVDRGERAVAEAATGTVHFCPYCGCDLEGATGVDVTCSRCGRGFTISPGESRAQPNVNLT